MLLVLSPAKTLDYESPCPTVTPTLPIFMERSAELVDVLRKCSPADIAGLMSVSDAIAHLNVARYACWSLSVTTENARPAIFAFNGDVYDGLDARALDSQALDYAQSHLRILSGLYGLLRPFDLLQPYRLEMGTRLATARGRNLYEFWGSLVTSAIARQMAETKSETLVNLASEEYFKVVRTAELDATVITPVFEEWKEGSYKIISFYAKHARGRMARFAARHAVTRPEQLQAFAEDGYAFNRNASTSLRWVFRRKQAR